MKWAVLISILVFLSATDGFALPVDTGTNSMGIYFDQDATENSIQLDQFILTNIFVILTNPDFDFFSGFGIRYHFEGESFLVTTTVYGDHAIDFGLNYDPLTHLTVYEGAPRATSRTCTCARPSTTRPSTRTTKR